MQEKKNKNKQTPRYPVLYLGYVQMNWRERATRTQASWSSILTFISWIQNAPLGSPSWDMAMMLWPAAQETAEVGAAKGSRKRLWMAMLPP